MLVTDENETNERDKLSPSERDKLSLGEFSGRVAIGTLIVVGIVTVAVGLWEARIVLALLTSAIIIASAIRPSVEWLAARHIPRVAAVLLHYAVLVGAIVLALWLVVPAATDQVQAALGGHLLQQEAKSSSGIKHEVLVALDKRLNDLPSGSALLDPAVEYGRKAFEVLLGGFFVLAAAAYWIFERDRAVDLVCSLFPRPKRKRMRETWDLIERRLGAFVRGQSLLVLLVATVLSAAFWAIGMPYWLLVGVFAGIVEIVPVIGPLIAGIVAVGVGLTASTQVALLAALIVLAVRLLEDYVVLPRVLGHSTGLSPLIVLISVTTVGLVLGGFAVILAVPIASVLVTLIDIIVREKDPAHELAPSIPDPQRP